MKPMTMKNAAKPSTKEPKMTGSAAGGMGRIEKSAGVGGKNSGVKLNK